MKPLRAILQEIPVNCSAGRVITPPWYTQQALRRQWLLHSDRWFCSKAFPGSTDKLCRPHPERRRTGLASADHQKLQPPPQVLSSSLLQENHFKSMNSRKQGYKHSPLYSAHSSPINHRCSSDSAKTSLIDFQWPGGWIGTANSLENILLSKECHPAAAVRNE